MLWNISFADTITGQGFVWNVNVAFIITFLSANGPARADGDLTGIEFGR